jgi:hypothetical protein
MEIEISLSKICSLVSISGIFNHEFILNTAENAIFLPKLLRNNKSLK